MKGEKIKIRKLAVLAFIAVMAGLIFLGVTPARGQTTWNVPGDGSNTCTTANPSCDTIQGAVNAASDGDSINVVAGTYTEQVVVSKSLTLTGADAATTIIQVPAVLVAEATGDTSLVEITGATTVASFSGFTVQGPRTGLTSGIHVHDGATATISGNIVKDIRDDPLSGAIHGLAINVGDSFFNAGNGGSATISNNEISGFQRVGIFVVGTGASATASNNTITGIGPTSTTIQLGISFQDGAASPVGSISGNTITDVVWTGDPSTTAVAIFLWDSANDISITNNTVWDSQTGIMVQAAEGIQISGNNISTPVGSKGIWLLGRGSTSTSCVGGDDVTPGLGCTTSATVADNTLIGAGAGYGVAIGQTPEVSTITWAPTTATLICNDVSGWDIGIRIGPASPANTVAAHFNNISGNATAGLLNANSSAVDAKNNWWGAADGPSGDGSGSGDAVLNTGTGSVDFDPWLKSPLTCDGKAVTICGTSGNDVLTGTLGPDVIHGFGGNDNISGGGGNDTICGGTGNDTINCGSGSDRLFGQGGSDALNGGPGNDRLVGGGGKDMLNGEAGNDVLLGGSSDDMLNGGTGTDKCDGGAHVGGDTATNCETVKNVP